MSDSFVEKFELYISPSVLASSSEEEDESISPTCTVTSSVADCTVPISPENSSKRKKMDDTSELDDYIAQFDFEAAIRERAAAAATIPTEVGDSVVEMSAAGSASSDSAKENSDDELTPEEMAKIITLGLSGADVSDEQRRKWNESMENTKRYEVGKAKEFQSLLDIVASKGGRISRLGSDVVMHEHKEVPALIKALKSARNKGTQVVILDECLKLFVEYRRQIDGSLYKPGSMKTIAKRIFSVLHLDYGIKIGVGDFSRKGSWRSYQTTVWNETRVEDKSFGVAAPKSDIEINDVEIVYEALRDGRLKPMEDPYHLFLLIMFIFLRLFGLRAVEAYKVDVSDVMFMEYKSGPDRGVGYCQVKIDFDKTKKLKWDQHEVPKDYGKLKIRDSPDDDVFNAYGFLLFYVSKLNPKCKSTRFLRRPIRRNHFVPDEEKVWFSGTNTSKDALTNSYRNLGLIIKEDAFMNITAHGGRACLITYSLAHAVNVKAICQQTRHKNESGMRPYRRLDEHSHKLFQDVLNGVFGREGVSEDEREDRKLPAKKLTRDAEGEKKGAALSSEVSRQPSEISDIERLQHEIKQLRRDMNEASPSKRPKIEAPSGTMSEEGGESGRLLEALKEENERMRKSLEWLGYPLPNTSTPPGVSMSSYGVNMQYQNNPQRNVVLPHNQGMHSPAFAGSGQLGYGTHFIPHSNLVSPRLPRHQSPNMTTGYHPEDCQPTPDTKCTSAPAQLGLAGSIDPPVEEREGPHDEERSKPFLDFSACVVM